MPRENVERMRQSLDALDRRDRAEWLSLRDGDCVVVTSRTWPEAGEIHGGEAAWDFYVEAADAFDRLTAGVSKISDAGSDRILVHYRDDLRGRTSGAAVEINYWLVVTFRQGKVLREEWFVDRAEALEALGLSE